MGFAGDAGADIGEVIVTTAQIPEGDEDAWTAVWKSTAERTAKRGEDSLAAGDPVSAREAFLRASSYYRSAEFYRRQDPLHDPLFVSANLRKDSPQRRRTLAGREGPLTSRAGETRPTASSSGTKMSWVQTPPPRQCSTRSGA
ncbi:hypothetical protein ACH4S9_34945 [Streptomyces sp. NPDC021225]|uniref:hypothetical protein n=1 Tax=Streptomyces sp. NPDC021225 TaxID=3365121 RepID=UPI00378EF70D